MITLAMNSESRQTMNALHMVTPQGADIGVIRQQPPLRPFSEEALAFVEALSKALLRDPRFRPFPELIAFGFWMRRRHVIELKELFDKQRDGRLWQAHGLIFHIAPANVDTIFLYSFILSLLVGNANIVRISSKRNAQMEAIIALLDDLLAQDAHEAVRRRLAVVRYGHDDAMTAYFSANCDLRVIWGGDETVSAIRRVPLPPHARDLVFPDKFSIAVFDAAAVLYADDLDEVARNFANDAYWFGQMACSSPRIVLWRGAKDACARASDVFWTALEKHAGRVATDLEAADFVNKFVAESGISMWRKVKVRLGKNNLINVIRFDDIDDLPIEEHCGAGLFYEVFIPDLNKIPGLIGRKLQTVASFGIKAREWADLLSASPPLGIDRVVPVGEALTFSPVWDGHDLLREFCREISIGEKL